ncbi:zinc finger protein 501 [Etheostoma spectabile]|uniref:zinc finger protein 501 n=1 Tax=Etheostoma spectabile TaxID=54343 RepID=UPI0013AF4CC9|nr:zinc finger protein 501-like [Etheostoma spectabile]
MLVSCLLNCLCSCSPVSCPFKMSTLNLLRTYVNQRLTVAVEDIIEMFERTITEYEEEMHLQRRLLGAEQSERTFSSQSGGSQEIQPLVVNPRATEPLRIKEEPEEVWIRRGLQGPDGADIPEFQFPAASAKSEDDEEIPHSSMLHHRQTEEPGEPEPPAQQTGAGAAVHHCEPSEAAFGLDVASFLKATSDGQFFLSQCFKTETEVLDDGWRHMIDSQPLSDPLKNNKAASPTSAHSQKTFYKCPACSKTFTHNAALQRHVTCHMGDRPFDCAECGKTFRQKGSLHIHMRKHTGEKPFCCLVCGKNFTQSGTLAAHMRIHTGEKPFSCSVCKKRYNESGTLVRHMRVHTGEKPFPCSLCGKRFSEKGNLNKHKRIHTGEKPFSCTACEKNFSLLSHLKNHKCPGKKSGETVEQALQLKS